ncbi:MAG: hypothetical protein ACKOI2_12705 [Actinomycetota bacterium]
MLTAVVTRAGETIQVRLVSAESEAGHEFDPTDCAYPPEASNPKECGPGPSPIIPEMKELAWGAGAFIVFALLMRMFLFPRLKRGMDARYNSVREGHENADATRSSARTEVAQYQAALASAKAEAAKVLEATRATLEAERQSQISAANTRISAQRDAALTQAEAARTAARSQVESAVADVVSSAIEIATGKMPDSSTVARAVADAMSAGVR